jgi:membrane protein
MKGWDLGEMSWKQFVRRVVKKLKDDDVSGHGAKLAYFAVLALFPIVLFITALLGIALKEPSTREKATQYLLKAVPESASTVIVGTVNEVSTKSGGGKLSLGLIGWLWAASSGMVAVMQALNVVYGVQERRAWWKARIVAVLLTLAFALLMVSAMTMLILGGPLARNLASHFGLGDQAALVWNLSRWPLLLALVLFAFNLVYRHAPNVAHQRWHWLMPGTVTGVALWLAASFAFSIYLQHFNRYSGTYGSIAGVIILLLWLYLSAQTVLIGAEVNAVTERENRMIAEKKS